MKTKVEYMKSVMPKYKDFILQEVDEKSFKEFVEWISFDRNQSNESVSRQPCIHIFGGGGSIWLALQMIRMASILSIPVIIHRTYSAGVFWNFIKNTIIVRVHGCHDFMHVASEQDQHHRNNISHDFMANNEFVDYAMDQLYIETFPAGMVHSEGNWIDATSRVYELMMGNNIGKQARIKMSAISSSHLFTPDFEHVGLISYNGFEQFHKLRFNVARGTEDWKGENQSISSFYKWLLKATGHSSESLFNAYESEIVAKHREIVDIPTTELSMKCLDYYLDVHSSHCPDESND